MERERPVRAVAQAYVNRNPTVTAVERDPYADIPYWMPTTRWEKKWTTPPVNAQAAIGKPSSHRASFLKWVAVPGKKVENFEEDDVDVEAAEKSGDVVEVTEAEGQGEKSTKEAVNGSKDEKEGVAKMDTDKPEETKVNDVEMELHNTSAEAGPKEVKKNPPEAPTVNEPDAGGEEDAPVFDKAAFAQKLPPSIQLGLLSVSKDAATPPNSALPVSPSAKKTTTLPPSSLSQNVITADDMQVDEPQASAAEKPSDLAPQGE
ncbi:hypothetical protein HDU96_000016 [Phlyctochytrium bullatum]|nr:hypothetical protein HDU96_000016 [Phlyctochytrium bullatum]